MKLTTKLLSAVLIITSTFGCSKKVIHEKSDEPLQSIHSLYSNNMPTLLNYMTALTTETDGQFGLCSDDNMFYRNHPKPIFFQGVALNNAKNPINIGEILVAGQQFNANPNKNNLYGDGYEFSNQLYNSQVSIKTNPDSTVNKGFSISENIYMPKKLEFSLPIVTQEFENNIISPNTLFSWSTDNVNTNGGVIVVIEYNPKAGGNEIVRVTSPSYVRNGLVIPDNGNYNLESSLFTDIPFNSEVLISFLRVNYKIAETSANKSYTIYTCDTKYFSFRYK